MTKISKIKIRFLERCMTIVSKKISEFNTQTSNNRYREKCYIILKLGPFFLNFWDLYIQFCDNKIHIHMSIF